MIYIDVEWIHSYEEDPVRLVSEIGPDNYEIRKLEFFRNGIVGFAYGDIETENTRLGIDIVPPLAEINSQEEFVGVTINKKQFELLWQEYVPRNS